MRQATEVILHMNIHLSLTHTQNLQTNPLPLIPPILLPILNPATKSTMPHILQMQVLHMNPIPHMQDLCMSLLIPHMKKLSMNLPSTNLLHTHNPVTKPQSELVHMSNLLTSLQSVHATGHHHLRTTVLHTVILSMGSQTGGQSLPTPYLLHQEAQNPLTPAAATKVLQSCLISWEFSLETVMSTSLLFFFFCFISSCWGFLSFCYVGFFLIGTEKS